MVYFYQFMNTVIHEYSDSNLARDLVLVERTEKDLLINVDLDNIDKFIKEYEDFKTPSVTCGILTYNEERCIKRCLNRLEDEFDEIIVLDSYSTDNTVEIIKSNFSKVQLKQLKWRNDFSYSRNKLLDFTDTDFIFFMDGDNYLSEESRGKIKKAAKIVKYLGITCVISPVIIEDNGHIYTDNRKMFLTNNNIFFVGKVHEEPLLDGKNVPQNITVDVVIHHDGYDPSLVNQKEKNSRNIHLTKQMITLEPNNPKWPYFYARELYKESTNKDSIDEVYSHVKEAINLYKNSLNPYKRYYAETLILMCKILLNKGDFKQLVYYTNELERLDENCIDVSYFRGLTLYTDVRNRINTVISSLLEEIEKNKHSFINSNNEHINLLLAQLYKSLDNWNMAMRSYGKVKSAELKGEVTHNMNEISTYIEKFQEKNSCI